MVTRFGMACFAMSVLLGVGRGIEQPEKVEKPNDQPPVTEGFKVDPKVAFIKTLEVTVTTANGADSGTDADIWLSVMIRVQGSAQTDGSTRWAGKGAGKGTTKTFTVTGARGDLSEERIGGLLLVDAMNGDSPDWEINHVRVVGIDNNGGRWLIADCTPYIKWLKNAPPTSGFIGIGPALPIPTMPWQKLQ